MLLTAALAAAKQQNIGITITDHIDFYFPGDDIYEFDCQKYFSAYKKYRDNENVLLGVEIGMQDTTAEQSQQFAVNQPFDMIIISQHILENYDLYYNDYYQNKDKQTAYRIYLEALIKGMNLHSFGNVLGHIDYICRKAPYNDVHLYYDEFSQQIDKLWQCALDNNIIPEINTRRFDNNINPKHLLPIYKRYHDMGGQYATIGSDAHVESAIGYKFMDAVCFLKEAGLIPVYFKNQQPVIMV